MLDVPSTEGLGLSHEADELDICFNERRPARRFVTCESVLGGAGVCCVEARQASAVIDMNQVLVRAIEGKQRLCFLYNGRARLVEPQCYGIGTRGTELLRAHQLQGGQEREPLFDVSKITDLEILNDMFVRPGPNYKRNDSAMKTIFAQL
jgi:hypothetical protein